MAIGSNMIGTVWNSVLGARYLPVTRSVYVTTMGVESGVAWYASERNRE